MSRNLAPDEGRVWLVCVETKCLQGNNYVRGVVYMFEDGGFLLN